MKRVKQVNLAATVVSLLLWASGCNFGGVAEEAQDNGIAIVVDGQAAAVIVIDPQAGSVIGNAAETLQREIHRRTDVKLPIVARDQAAPDKATIHLGTLDQDVTLTRALAALGRQPVIAENPGKEGFTVVSGRQGSAGFVVINGCDDVGTFHGVGWLLRRMGFSESGASVPLGLSVETAPATEMRYIRFGDHYGYVNTELSGWRELWSDYILWGLSAAIFRCDPAHQGDPRETVAAKYLWDKWTERVPLARSLGLEVIHLTQTNMTFKDGEFGPGQVPNFKELNFKCRDRNGVNPKFERGRKLLYDSRKWFFDHMPHSEQVNYYLTSGWDSGGCWDPAVAPWSLTYPELVDTITYPLVKRRNPNAKILLGLYWQKKLGSVDPLFEKLASGWEPEWLHGIEFVSENADKAKLLPPKFKRHFFIMGITNQLKVWGGCHQSGGAAPVPSLLEKSFRKAYFEDGIQDGFGPYS